MPRAPISTIKTSASSGALNRVNGTPSSLLNDRSLAWVLRVFPMAAKARSLTDVLPTEPVIPMTGPVCLARA